MQRRRLVVIELSALSPVACAAIATDDPCNLVLHVWLHGHLHVGLPHGRLHCLCHKKSKRDAPIYCEQGIDWGGGRLLARSTMYGSSSVPPVSRDMLHFLPFANRLRQLAMFRPVNLFRPPTSLQFIQPQSWLPRILCRPNQTPKNHHLQVRHAASMYS